MEKELRQNWEKGGERIGRGRRGYREVGKGTQDANGGRERHQLWYGEKGQGYREEEDGELKRGGIGDMKGGQSR